MFIDQDDISVTLRELTDGRGPDSTIDAVDMEAHGAGAPLAELAQKAAGMLPDAITAKVTEKAAHVKQWTPGILPLLEGDDDPLGVDDFTTHQWPLDKAPEACPMFQKKEDGAIKVALKP
jgi:hypothetical protein